MGAKEVALDAVLEPCTTLHQLHEELVYAAGRLFTDPLSGEFINQDWPGRSILRLGGSLNVLLEIQGCFIQHAGVCHA